MSPPTVDVLIVGGGPAGLYAGLRFARDGFQALVCEEHAVIGDPVHCTGVLAAESFDELDLPREATINTLTAAKFVSPSGLIVTYTPRSPLAAVIDRPAFDRVLAARAVAAGAEVRTAVRVSHIEIAAGGIGAQVGDSWIRARLLVLACGANYAWQRRFGLGLPRLYLHTAQRELPAVPVGHVEVHFGRTVAPDGFAWAVPVARPDGPHVRVGVMTSHDAPAYYARAVSRFAERSLAAYEHAWRAELAEEFGAQHAMRSIVTRFTDREIDSLFDLARTDGIMPIVRSTAMFNRHRDLIRALFKHPPARRILFRVIGG